MPRINVNATLIGFDGEAIHEIDFQKPPVNGRPARSDKALNLRDVCINALSVDYRDEQIDGRKKYERGQIANKIARASRHEGGNCVLTSEEVVEVKNVIAKFYAPEVMFPAWNLLDPPPVEGEAQAA